MKYFKCENCGSELTKNADNTYSCAYCKRTYYDDSLEKAYDRVYQNLRGTVQGIVSEELLKQKIEQIATCRQALYKECNEQFVDNTEIERWAGEILKLSPKDAQANFYFLAAKKRWSELNKFMQKLNAREVSYLVDGFVDYLTNGQFVEKCVLCLSDLIDRAFDGGSEEYAVCHKKIVQADERERSGIFDVSLPRDVFVAYSSKDKEKAYELVEYLEKNGFTCFIAMRNLAKGVDAALKYNERLKKAMDSCRVFLLVSSSNSRARDCDAYRIEMQYVRDCDCKKANDYALANARYEEYLEKNRNRCKPRVEYLIEEYGSSPYEKIVKKFFGGLTWCRNLESVSDAVFELIEGVEFEESQADKFARERAEFETQKAEMERQKAEFARKEQELSRNQNTSAPSGNIDDLYKAFKERERAEEEERKRKEEEERKRREEEERKRQEEERVKRDFQIENGELKEYRGDGGSVTIPDAVTSIGVKAFANCGSLTSVTIPDTVTSIGNSAFEGCSKLMSVTIPNSVTSIRYRAFCGCTSLTSVTIPDSVTSIESGVFENCYKLQYSEYNNAKYLGNENNKYLVLVKAKATSIKSCIIHENTKLIASSAFRVCESLTNVTIPNSVTSIADWAFYGCTSLTSVKIPDSVTSIGAWAFYGCSKFTSVTIPNSVTSIVIGVFSGCTSLTNVTIPNSVTSIGDQAFMNCTSLTNVTIPDSVTAIGDRTFANCGALTSVTIPNSVTSIDNHAFSNCTSLTWVNLSDNVTIGDSAFDKGTEISRFKTEAECKRKEEEERIKRDFEIRNGELKKYKGNGGDVVIPNSVTSIADRAFENCDSLTSVKIPDSVTLIGSEVFYDCKSLTSIQIPNSVTAIGKKTFYYCRGVKNITIPNSVVSIGDSAFESCGCLTSIIIPNSVKTIGARAFANCGGLTSVTIPDSVTSIGYSAFESCSKLMSVTISDSVTRIAKETFKYCRGLTSIVIPDSVTSIGDSTFIGCKGLTSVTIPNSVTSIGGYAFFGCIGLQRVEIPNSITSIGQSAFYGCTVLTIYAEAKSKPKGWYSVLFGSNKGSWNPHKCPVKWGTIIEDFDDDE